MIIVIDENSTPGDYHFIVTVDPDAAGDESHVAHGILITTTY